MIENRQLTNAMRQALEEAINWTEVTYTSIAAAPAETFIGGYRGSFGVFEICKQGAKERHFPIDQMREAFLSFHARLALTAISTNLGLQYEIRENEIYVRARGNDDRN